MRHQLRDGSTAGGALLQPVPREAVAKHQVGDFRVQPDDSVLVEGVVFVEAGPGGLELEVAEGGHAVVKGWPD
eukprot:CAMPEP_0173246958 /NCGR_PEP_ID=MMETSP1142-20121109/17622_1 /TAXON_ID=483371 /ORGANISM="non described non described, Strain CCMP2298" /LENGTH=72 /DNA_ID=CAMNT_0014179271 /DNA_START=187 /DNA_END=405 /DNA_ORIENTATION=-